MLNICEKEMRIAANCNTWLCYIVAKCFNTALSISPETIDRANAITSASVLGDDKNILIIKASFGKFLHLLFTGL